MAQALGFAFLLGGGVLVLAAWTGQSPAKVVKGEAGSSPAKLGGAGSEGPIEGSVQAGQAGINSPFPGNVKPTRGRTDQGVDFSAPAGTPLLAMADAIITRIDPNFYAGQPAIYYRALSGPLAGREIYYSEQLTPDVRQGQRVSAGQRIATVAPSGSGLELGYGSGGIPAAKSEGYTEGRSTHYGEAFSSLLSQFGL